MIELINDDCLNVYYSRYLLSKVNAIICDPPYDADYELVGWMQGMAAIEQINLVAFCKPENQFFKPDEYLFWVKTPSTKNYSKNCGRFVEMILVLRNGETFNQLHWSQMTGVYDDRLVNPPIHPFEKPLSLMERLVRIYTNPGDVVLDPFMGCGTTGLACLNLGRSFIGIEKDKEVFELAKSRIERRGMKVEE